MAKKDKNVTDTKLKDNETVQPEETTQEGNTEQRGKPAPIKNGYVSYMLPFVPGANPGDSETVGLNGVNYQVQYGVQVEIPKGVAEILDRRQKQRVLLIKKIEEARKEKCITKIEN